MRNALFERRRRLQALCSDMRTWTSLLPVFRRGAEVVSGVDMLAKLSTMWGKPEIAGESPIVRSAVDSSVVMLMDLRQALLWGMVLPQAQLAEQVVSSLRDPSIAFPSSEKQIDVFSRVQRARLEVRAMLLELDKRLSTAKRGFLHAGRLTTADIVAVAVLDGVVSIVCQGWIDYP